jgi:RNA polymerase sigma-70 factor (ECF subfamily)
MSVRAVSQPARSGAWRRQAEVRPLDPWRGDAELVEGLKAGKSGARAALFDRHARDVERVLARILGDDAELQDLVQDVFLRAFEGCGRIESPEKLRSWMVAISVFTARERIRRRRRKWWMVLVPQQSLEGAPATEPATRLQGEARELAAATYRVLDRLDDDDRIALALRLLEGMELEEVARATGVSLSTAKRRVYRAQERFRLLAAGEPHLVDWYEGGGA